MRLKNILPVSLLGVTTLLLALCTSFAPAGNPDDLSYDITFEIKGLKSQEIQIAYHYGDKQYIKDTLMSDDNGTVHYKGDTLPGGIYMFVMPDRTYFEFIVSGAEHKFKLATHRNDPVNSMKVTGSVENEVFYGNLKLVNKYQKEIGKTGDWLEVNQAIQDSLGAGARPGLTDSIVHMKNKQKDLSDAIADSRIKLMKDHPDLFYTKVLETMKEPDVPESPKDENGNVIDSTWAFYYFRNHFFDNVDFSDDRLLRTPVYHSKLMKYIDNLVTKHPDSLCVHTERVSEMAKANKEVFKYTVIVYLNKYAKSKIMCMDKVYVCMVEKYYGTGQAWWADSVSVYRIVDRAKVLRPILCNEKAPRLKLMDPSNSMRDLYEVPTRFTIMVFWDPDCGHCKKAMPKLKKIYDEMKGKGIEVYAICTESEVEKWKKFIKEKDMEDWINVADPAHRSNFRVDYDISSTPKIFLLNRDKKIIAKGIGVEQLGEILNDYLKRAEDKDSD